MICFYQGPIVKSYRSLTAPGILADHKIISLVFSKKVERKDLSKIGKVKSYSSLKASLMIKKGIVFDHNHTTNKFRGWLCGRCNTGLGLFGDKLEILELAIKYLKKYEQK